MTNFNCIHCGSNRIKLVKAIFESETEAKYQNQEDYTATPTTKEILESKNNVVITLQSGLANKLGNLTFKNQEKWEKFLDSETYNYKSRKKEELIRKKTEKKELKKEGKIIIENQNNTTGFKYYNLNPFFEPKIIVWILLIICLFLMIGNLLELISPFLRTVWILICFLFFILLLFDFAYLTSYVRIKNQKEAESMKPFIPLLLKIKSFEEKVKSKLIQFKKLRDNYENKLEKRLTIFFSYIEEEENQIKELEEEINQMEENAKQQAEQLAENVNEVKLRIWSNLYYCYDCNYVMDLKTKSNDKAEKINKLVDQLQTT